MTTSSKKPTNRKQTPEADLQIGEIRSQAHKVGRGASLTTQIVTKLTAPHQTELEHYYGLLMDAMRAVGLGFDARVVDDHGRIIDHDCRL